MTQNTPAQPEERPQEATPQAPQGVTRRPPTISL